MNLAAAPKPLRCKALVAISLILAAALSGCASHYIAADKDMSRMSAAQLTLELAKP